MRPQESQPLLQADPARGEDRQARAPGEVSLDLVERNRIGIRQPDGSSQLWTARLFYGPYSSSVEKPASAGRRPAASPLLLGPTRPVRVCRSAAHPAVTSQASRQRGPVSRRDKSGRNHQATQRSVCAVSRRMSLPTGVDDWDVGGGRPRKNCMCFHGRPLALSRGSTNTARTWGHWDPHFGRPIVAVTAGPRQEGRPRRVGGCQPRRCSASARVVTTLSGLWWPYWPAAPCTVPAAATPRGGICEAQHHSSGATTASPGALQCARPSTPPTGNTTAIQQHTQSVELRPPVPRAYLAPSVRLGGAFRTCRRPPSTGAWFRCLQGRGPRKTR